jgi:phenylpropionate dioxygenase-like ring-hydroxylating dioxygenase large terminal subunit
MQTQPRDLAIPDSWDRSGLPAWTYANAELLELEQEVLFRRSWQLAGHESDLPEPGDYLTLDLVGERALIVRGRDGVVRAFHNVCRHRGSRVVADERGTCRSAIVCPFHGWTYNLDGTLRGAARPQTFPPLDNAAWGLKPIELELWQGFVFVRFKPSPQPSVGAILAPFASEVAAYRPQELVPAGEQAWSEHVAVNWKAVRDVDNEGYHVPKAHPGLFDLYGQGYSDEPFVAGASRSFAPFNDGPGSLWSVRKYKRILPENPSLPPSHRRAWVYLGLFPNTVLGLYPDLLMFYQEFPLAIGRTLQRGRSYRYREESRELRLARYLSGRIDRDTVEEDAQLIVWSYEAAHSSGYDGVILSDLEYGVRSYHDHLRRLLPVMTLPTPPATGTLAQVNRELLEEGA